METDLLRAHEVAHRLAVCVRTVWAWTAAGKLPAPFRQGRITRWRKCDIDDYVRSSRGQPPPRRSA
jgi:excisionase family DNA binding protein